MSRRRWRCSRNPTVCTHKPDVRLGGSHNSAMQPTRCACGQCRTFGSMATRPTTQMEEPHEDNLDRNLKTVKVLELTIPPSLRLRADEVIE